MNIYITEEEADNIAEWVDGEPYYNYSGRGMYGQTCFGITHSGNDVRIGLGFADVFGLEFAIDALDQWSVASDSMGMDKITYFTNIKVTDKLTRDQLDCGLEPEDDE